MTDWELEKVLRKIRSDLDEKKPSLRRQSHYRPAHELRRIAMASARRREMRRLAARQRLGLSR